MRGLTGVDLSDDVFSVGQGGTKIQRYTREARRFHLGRYRGELIDEVYHRMRRAGSDVTFTAISNWIPSDVAARNNLAHVAAGS